MQAENIMLVDKHKIEKEQNSQLRNQVAQLLQLEQEQKMQIKQRDSTIQALQVCLALLSKWLLLSLFFIYLFLASGLSYELSFSAFP